MEWEKSEREMHDPLGYFTAMYDNIVAEEWGKQPDPRYWVLPPRTRSVATGIKNYRERGLQQLPTYLNRCLDAPWEISHIEKQFEIDLDGITVRGGVDRILFWASDEFYAVEDIKTGNIKGEDDVRQLAFYAFVARELWDVPVYHGRYWFSKLDRGSQFVDLTRFDRDFWEREFHRLDAGVSQNIFLAHPGDQCGVCGVRPWCSVMGTKKIGEPLGE